MNTASRADFGAHSMWLGGGGGGRTGDRMAKDKKILAVTCWGWGAVQDVQEHNLHPFDQQI